MYNKKYPFVDLQPGDYVFLPDEVYGGAAHAAARTTQRRLGWTLEVRSMDSGGIAVWRTDGADVCVPGNCAKIGRPSVYGFGALKTGASLYYPHEITGGKVYDASRIYGRRNGFKVSGRRCGTGIIIERRES